MIYSYDETFDEGYGREAVRHVKMTVKTDNKQGEVSIDNSKPDKFTVPKRVGGSRVTNFQRRGEFHTHPSDEAPSGQDLYSMGKGSTSFNPGNGFFSIIATEETKYALVVVDSDAYKKFQSSNSLSDVNATYNSFQAEAQTAHGLTNRSEITEYAIKATMQHYKTGVNLYQIYDNNTTGKDANWTKKN